MIICFNIVNKLNFKLLLVFNYMFPVDNNLNDVQNSNWIKLDLLKVHFLFLLLLYICDNETIQADW